MSFFFVGVFSYEWRERIELVTPSMKMKTMRGDVQTLPDSSKVENFEESKRNGILTESRSSTYQVSTECRLDFDRSEFLQFGGAGGGDAPAAASKPDDHGSRLRSCHSCFCYHGS